MSSPHPGAIGSEALLFEDLEADPLETTNRYCDPAYAEDVERLKRELDALKTSCGDTDEAYPEVLALRERLG